MTHLGFVATSYALGVAVPVGLAVSSLLRLARARRTLRAIDPRAATMGAGSVRGEP